MLTLYSIWDAVFDHISGKEISSGNAKISIPVEFFNQQPFLRNLRFGQEDKKLKYPFLVVRIFSPVESTTLFINEKIKHKVSLEAASPYLELPGMLSLEKDVYFMLKRGYEGRKGQQYFDLQPVVFRTSDFQDSNNIKLTELLDLLNSQLKGVVCEINEQKNIVRIIHSLSGGFSTLEIINQRGGEYISKLPKHQVVGVSAGKGILFEEPPLCHNFLIHVTHATKQFNHFALLSNLVGRFFILPKGRNQRALFLGNQYFEVRKGLPIDDPVIEEGVFISTVPYTLINVPLYGYQPGFDEIYNGGNYSGNGIPEVTAVPKTATIELGVTSL